MAIRLLAWLKEEKLCLVLYRATQSRFSPDGEVNSPLGEQEIPTDVVEFSIDLTRDCDRAGIAFLQDLERISLSNFAGGIQNPKALMDAISQLTNLRELDLTVIPTYGLSPLANLSNA